MDKIDTVVQPLASQREFFGCPEEDWPDEDLDLFVGILRTYPGGDFLDELPIDARRNYAMSCIWLKENHREKYEEAIVMGKAWRQTMTTVGFG
jgi:hypothetical protein